MLSAESEFLFREPEEREHWFLQTPHPLPENVPSLGSSETSLNWIAIMRPPPQRERPERGKIFVRVPLLLG